MTYPELLEKIRSLPNAEVRTADEEWLEIVLEGDSLEKGREILEGFFGAAVKPAGQAPGPDVLAVADALGGCRKNQILFCRNEETGSFCALLWPWSDGSTSTVKIFRSARRIPGGGGMEKPEGSIFRKVFKKLGFPS